MDSRQPETDKNIRNLLNILREYMSKIHVIKSPEPEKKLLEIARRILPLINTLDPHGVVNKLQALSNYYELYEKKKNMNKQAQTQKINVWVDDMHAPPDGWDWVWAKNYGEAIALLETGNVGKMSLDHDLGDENAKSGYDTVNWVEEAAYNNSIPPIEFGIHTDNPVGRDRMKAGIQNAYKYWKKHQENELV